MTFMPFHRHYMLYYWQFHGRSPPGIKKKYGKHEFPCLSTENAVSNLHVT